jgi:hypothetical protein
LWESIHLSLALADHLAVAKSLQASNNGVKRERKAMIQNAGFIRLAE